MSFWKFIKAVIRALLNESSRLTGPAQIRDQYEQRVQYTTGGWGRD